MIPSLLLWLSLGLGARLYLGRAAGSPGLVKRIARRASSRGSADLGVIFVVSAVVLAMVAFGLHSCAEGDRCARRGGTWVCGYKSSCVCFAKGVVLP